MKARRRKQSSDGAAPKLKSPKRKHGGRRTGAGRKPSGAKAMSAGIYLRCSEEQKAALAAFVDDRNEIRAKHNLGKIDLSTWIRELALKHAGCEDLGIAAQARARADAAESIAG